MNDLYFRDRPNGTMVSRHASWATLLLSRGAPPPKVMAKGGWKNLETMMIYLRKSGIDLKDATQCIDHLDTHGVELAEAHDIRGK